MACSDCIQHTASSAAFFSRLRNKKEPGETPFPMSGSLEVTLRCNVRCSHCYILYPGATDNEMNTAEMKTVLKKLADAGVVFLLLTGGEPLSRADFKEIYLYCKTLGIIPTVYTNATLIDEDWVRFFKQYPPRRFEITIYGHTEETYEAVTGVKGSFKRFRNGVQLLIDAGLRVDLKTIILNTNKHEFEDIRAWALNLTHEFRYDMDINPRLDGGTSVLGERISPEEHLHFQETFPSFESYYKQEAEKWSKTTPPKQLFTCGHGVRTFHVDPAGNLHPCMVWRKNPYNLLQHDIDENWNRVVHEMHQAPALDKGCNSCSQHGVCGRCPAFAGLETGRPDKPVSYFCEISSMRKAKFGAPENLKIEIV